MQLSSPSLPNPQRDYLTRLLFLIQRWISIVLVISLLLTIIFTINQAILPVAAGLFATGASIWLNRRGRAEAAGMTLLGSLLVVEFMLLINGNGIHDFTIIVLPIILVISSLLLNRNKFVVVSFLTILGVLLVGILEITGVVVNNLSFATDTIDLVLLLVILVLAAVVVRRMADSLVRSLADAHRRLEHLTTLNRVSTAISSGLELEQTLATLHERIQEVAPCHAFSVALYNHASTELTFPIFMDLGKKVYVPPSEIRDQPGLTGEVISRRAPLYLADLHDPRCTGDLNAVRVGYSKIRTYLGYPLIQQDEVIGVMSVQSERPHAYGPDQISLLETIAAQAAIALENARLYNALHTELQGRRRVEEDLHRRDSILEAVSLAAGKFMTGSDWRGGIRAVLARLGQETGSRHASICTVSLAAQSAGGAPAGDSVPQIASLYDWAAGDAPSFDNHCIYPHAAASEGFTRWMDATWAGEAFTAQLFPPARPPAEAGAEPQPAASHLTVPIRVSGELWGFIDFEACGEKTWSEVEIEAIQVAAGLLGAAIGRQRDDDHIHRLNAELEARVRERTSDLESFAYSVAHDLRAPLRGIDGYSKLLLDDYSCKLESDGVAYLHNVRRAAQWMGQIIEDLLKLSRVTRVEMHSACVDLSQIAVEIAGRLSSLEPERAVSWNIQPGLSVVGDQNLLRLALENLLHNSWKFTEHAPVACIEFGAIAPTPAGTGGLAEPQSPGSAYGSDAFFGPGEAVIPSDAVLQPPPERIFYVRDNGAGFDMRYADKLFTPFQRMHTSDEFEGAGIGLATVRRILRRHNGDVWARAARNQGACFFFSLP